MYFSTPRKYLQSNFVFYWKLKNLRLRDAMKRVQASGFLAFYGAIFYGLLEHSKLSSKY